MGFLSDGWAWLDTNSKQIGALSSIAFGLSSAAVAWVALRLNYRNNFAWKPMLSVLSSGSGFYGGGQRGVVGADTRIVAYVEFEIWNRRKYPVVVREIIVEFATRAEAVGPYGYNFGWHVEPEKMYKEEEPPDAPLWHITTEGRVLTSTSMTVGVGESRALQATGVVPKEDRDQRVEQVWVRIFDPKKVRSSVCYWSRKKPTLLERLGVLVRGRTMPKLRGYSFAKRGAKAFDREGEELS